MFLGGIYKISEHDVMQFNILTTDPNQRINDFHHRMPVIVPAENVEAWMQSKGIGELYQMAKPYQGDLIIYECDSYVDNGRHEGPRCMELIASKLAESSAE